ncbi:hypothetical protein Lal_00041767 [Lupinus albus]|nr:hypothetical protein Lal_00041767 [Lupinus albus]
MKSFHDSYHKNNKTPLCVCEYKVYFLFFKVLYDFRMGNTGHLHRINPEIDRTYHSLVRQIRKLPFQSVPDFVSDSDSISDSIPVYVHSVQYTDFVHSVALSDSEHFENFVHSENMAQPPTPPGPQKLERKIDSLTTLVTQLAMNQQKQPMARVCGICTSPNHYNDVCPSLLEPRTTDHPEVYAANIYNNRPNQQQQNYDPSSSRYNPNWRNHPNLKWSDHTQQQPPHAPFRNNNAGHNRPYVPPSIQQQRQEQVINNPPLVPSEPSLEELITFIPKYYQINYNVK